MGTWNVTITETLARTIPVEAEDAASAEGIVRDMYGRCEIVLAAEDIRGTEITAGQEGVCPLCGAGIEYAGENDIDDGGGTFPWTCPGCGAHGREGYSRRFSGHLDVDDGKGGSPPRSLPPAHPCGPGRRSGRCRTCTGWSS